MKKRRIGLAALVLVIVLVASVMSGCGNNKADNEQGENNQSMKENDQTGQSNENVQDETGKVKLPIVDKTLEIKVWSPLHANAVAAKVNDLNEVWAVQELEKRTNIKINWTTPPDQNKVESYNLLVNSGNLPDIIGKDWPSTDLAIAIDNGVVQPIDGLIEQYAPNIKKYLDENPMLKSQVTSYDGHIYVLPMANVNPELLGGLYVSMVIRNDWLKEINMSAPKSMDEWYEALKAFKEKHPDSVPLTATKPAGNLPGQVGINRFLFNGFGMEFGFYQVNGTVKFGMLESESKQVMEYGKKLFDEKLLDPDFLMNTWQQIEQKILNNQVGAVYGFNQPRLSLAFKDMIKDKAPNYEMWVTDYPHAADGKMYVFEPQVLNTYRGIGWTLTSKAQNVEQIMKWLDYQYTDEGMLLIRYGQEGETYKLNADGKPAYTDAVNKNPDGLTPIQVQAKYTSTCCYWPFKDTKVDPNDADWRETMKGTWGQDLKLLDDMVNIRSRMDTSRMLPPLSFTIDESKTIAAKLAEIQPYVDQTFAKFITGHSPLTEHDSFVSQLKNMGIDEVMKIYQDALDRYNKK